MSTGITKSTELIGLRWTVIPRPVGAAQIRFRVAGRQVAISTGHARPDALSRDEQRDMIARWADARGVVLQPSTEGPTLAIEIERFLTLQYEGASPNTVREARRYLLQFREVLGVQVVPEVTKALCEARKAALQEGRAPKHWKNFLTTIRKFLRWEVGEGNLQEMPLANFKNPGRKAFGRRTGVWTPERLQATLDELEAEDREILQVIRWTGMDPSDFWDLQKKHVLQAMGPNGRFWKLYKLRAKAHSEDEVMDQPLSSKILPLVLARWEAAGSPETKLWPSVYCDGESFADAFLRRHKAAQARAGQTPELTTKHLRHTYASYHAERYINGEGGPPMEELRRWMGHARDSRTLERLYVHAKSSGRFMD